MEVPAVVSLEIKVEVLVLVTLDLKVVSLDTENLDMKEEILVRVVVVI